MSGFIEAAGNLIHSIGECFSAIWDCIKSLGRAFWSALKILWFAYETYVEFICAIFDGLWNLVKSGAALLVQIFIPPRGHRTGIDKKVGAIIGAIDDLINENSYLVDVSEFEKYEANGAYMTVGINKATGAIINNNQGKPLTFTGDIDEKSKQLLRRNNGAAVVGTFA